MKLLKKLASFLFSRLFIVALMMILQIVLIFGIIYLFSRNSVYVYIFLEILSALIALWLVSEDGVPEFKISWIVFVLSIPMIGGVFYLIFGNKRVPRKFQAHLDATTLDMEEFLPNLGLLPENPYNQLHANYVQNLSGYPVYGNSDFEYYPVGDEMFVRMMEEMKKAKFYICLEFFIVSPGRMLDDMMAVMKEKIDEGVEIFFMYDDFGTIFNLPKEYRLRLEKMGVHLCVFNPFRPHLSSILNHRDHRKILLIDGIIAFSGGINIADEYINEKERFGHWKDTGILVRGEAAWAFGVMFFQLWNFAGGTKVDIKAYEPTEHYQVEGDGLVQIFADTPMDDHTVTESVYLRSISQAQDYIFIATPYLVIDYAMQEALCTAAQSGVDVRIMTPHIYDKWYVHLLTTSHYKHLISSGVKIYEYTPGFLHGKMFVADDRVGVVGSSNMDFRSFYLHFECSVLLYENKILDAIKQDLIDTQAVSQQVTIEEVLRFPLYVRLLQYILKIFAPLM